MQPFAPTKVERNESFAPAHPLSWRFTAARECSGSFVVGRAGISSGPRAQSRTAFIMASPDGAAPPAPTEEQPKTPEELTAFVQSLLEQMQSRFTEMSTSIISRIDQMGDRIADLEASIGELMVQAGATGEGEGDAGDA